MVDLRSRVAFVFLLLLLLCESTLEQLTESPSSPSERLTLLALRSSLGLTAKDWPIKADPCSVWNGIRCENGSVAGINISGFRRTRIGKQNPRFAVDSLVNLTNLVSFNASKFSLPGSIPDWFGQRLSRLQVLDLSSCAIAGVIPESLGNMTGLRTLNLSGNSFTGSVPASLGQLSNLLSLDLSMNSLTGSIPLSFGNLRNLSSLDLSSNYLSGSIPPSIGLLAKLVSLNLSNNSFSSSIPPQLGNLISLVDLDLSINTLSGFLTRHLRRLRNLQKFAIGDNLLVGSLPVDFFDVLVKLQVVTVEHNSFSGRIPDKLWRLPKLQELDLSDNNFTDLLPNFSLNSNLTAAELNISDNMFYGPLTAILGRFNVLDLSGNYFEGKVPSTVLGKAFLAGNCLQNVSRQRGSSACTSFYVKRGLTFDNFGRPNSTNSPEKKSSGLSLRTIIILAAIGGFVLILIIIALTILIVLCMCKNGGTGQRGNGVGPVPAGESHQHAAPLVDFSNLGVSYTYQQLVHATSEFDDANLIKHGHSGDLFRGLLESGIPVVIKRIDLQSNRSEAYISELEFFSRVSHPRLVPLLGHCLENENQKFLVYKYMPNGDLASSLYRKSDTEDEGLQSLDWITRLKIAIGAAEGLSYLHHECSPPFVHRDVQASSILLEDKFEVRLGSLSEGCAQEGDSHQSRITRLLRLPQSSEQSTSGSATAMCTYDVYCFGKVLLELVTGKLGITAFGDTQLREYLDETLPYVNINEKELVTKILDPSLIVDEDLLEEVWAMAIVAKSCLNPKPSRRPLMKYILKALENPLKVVREETAGSARLQTNSSRGSWNAAIFGSWRHSSDVTVIPPAGGSGLKNVGTTTSQGSGHNGNSGENSGSRRRHSKEIVPEPSD